MEEAPENGKESSHSARANRMIEMNEQSLVYWIQLSLFITLSIMEVT
jgi:hypothetical protein